MKLLNINKVLRFSAAALLCGSLAACVIQPPAQPGAAAFAPAHDVPAPLPTPTSGSLYREGVGLALYSDRKAHRVGDIIEIILSERTTSTKSSSLVTKKENTIDIQEAQGGVGTILGSNVSAANLSLLTDLIGKRNFSGNGDAEQNNSLDGSITVTVSGVQSNGNLLVRGEKWMTLNQGDEYIRISGILRPDDIAPNNTVASTKLANARITYSGEGAVANSSRMGWLSRFFNSEYWPF
ncbi:flagellar basal body L-ring protein FlgH [uncultured Pseudoteredinibacter sp.]|uniref:flagellar basal body L-ring protein FlgH n=1 Tax=uncultured Pseudoteredinibacter sp. TaxID=1641701 RepID=UPI00260BC491|nr:flagellar basal body L-ring protein FlgH [uncultured Pseudoteredinibacter sp.]